MGILQSKKKRDLICCGLDNSGKTTIINQLKPTKTRTEHLEPTVGYSVEQFSKGKVNFTVFDMGGAKQFRSLWTHYYQNVQGVIFVIDTSDKIRMVIVKDELKMLIEHKDLAGVPILFFANKIDIAGSLSPQDCVEQLGLMELLHDRTFQIFPSDARRGIGLQEGIEWLSSIVEKNDD
ncbi:ADP-ribosylation factor-like protein 6 [Diplonema papillatum]|nr:ADP-ribosylation factor-like protein 6 [Diplonema papillatum]